VRAFDPSSDARHWLALHNRVFAGHPEQESWGMADLHARFDQPWFDPNDLLIAERGSGSEMVGFCWVKLPPDPKTPGEIYIVGVSPECRGGGLGLFLTRAGLAHMRANGRPGATLYVESDNHAAIALYRKLGFEPRWEHVCYVRGLKTA
jgi:mycothiol synthase